MFGRSARKNVIQLVVVEEDFDAIHLSRACDQAPRDLVT